eukprot:UN03026
MSCFDVSTQTTLNTTMCATSKDMHTDAPTTRYNSTMYQSNQTDDTSSFTDFKEYITLGILSFMAVMLIICCLIFWTTLHLHQKTTKKLITNSDDIIKTAELQNKMGGKNETVDIKLGNIELTEN